MILKENTSQQKLRGAYYTPLPLAEKIVEYFKNDISLKTVIEPSCGDGVFFDALIDQKIIASLQNLTGIEIEKDETEKLSAKLSSYPNIQIQNADFFDFY